MMGGWKRDGNHSPPKILISTGFREKWKKGIFSSRLQQNKERLSQGTQQSPQEHTERRNPPTNHWEFHSDVNRQDQPKCTGGNQEIPRTKIKNMRRHKNK
jgi:hypothetical protein